MMSGKARAGTAKERSVFVGNIPYDVTEEMLKEIFSGAGTVVNFRLVTDRETGKPKGYGFCEYADGATALSAMRNLNGYEVNGRNLRVDFADGGDKSGGGGGGGNHHHNGGGGGGGYSNDKQHPTAVSGEVIIQAIENAISRFGPLKLYDMLVELKEHARQRPDHTKSMLTANPALTHAIVQCFKTLNIPIPSSTEMPPALLAPPPPHLHAPPLMGRPMGPPPPQRSPMGGPPGVGGGGGILGMAPPGPPPPPPGSMGMPPPPVGVQAPPAKAGGTRWSARPGPLAGLMAPPGSGGMVGPPLLQQQQQQQHQQPAALPSYQGLPPPLMNMPPPPMGAAAAQQQMSRDPRRARDPRLAKRPLASEPVVDPKRPRPDDHQFHQQHHQQQHQGPPGQGNGTFDAIAELARDMTPQKLNMLPPNERQILMMYMQQHGMPFTS